MEGLRVTWMQPDSQGEDTVTWGHITPKHHPLTGAVTTHAILNTEGIPVPESIGNFPYSYLGPAYMSSSPAQVDLVPRLGSSFFQGRKTD